MDEFDYQQQQQYQEINRQQQGIIGQMQQQTTEQVKFFLNVEEIIAQFQIILRRMKVDYVKGQWVQEGEQKPMMNEEGVTAALHELNLRLNRIFNLTYYENYQVLMQRLKVYDYNVALLFVVNHRKWALARADIPLIVHNIIDAVEANALKSVKGNMQGFLKGNVQSTETRMFGPPTFTDRINLFGNRQGQGGR